MVPFNYAEIGIGPYDRRRNRLNVTPDRDSM